MNCCGRCKICDPEWKEIEAERDAANARAEAAEREMGQAWHNAGLRSKERDAARAALVDAKTILKTCRRVVPCFGPYMKQIDDYFSKHGPPGNTEEIKP